MLQIEGPFEGVENKRYQMHALAETKINFQNVFQRVSRYHAKVPRDVALELYALYKQANHGNVAGKRPLALFFMQRAKYDAWFAKEDMSCLEAMQTYIHLAEAWVMSFIRAV